MPRPVTSQGQPPSRMFGGILAISMLVACLILPAQTAAQAEGRVYAIRDARLVTTAGRVIENGTIVLRGGLIEAVGTDVTPPADAVLIDGEGLTVYPGFIDAFSQAGFIRPQRPQQRQQPQQPQQMQQQEPESVANIAHRLATDRFDADHDDLTTYRNQGFTTALIARDDGVFAGKAVLIDLLGENVPEMTVKAPVIQVMGYTGQRGYPGTLMAVVAYQRQTLIDAAYHDLLKTRYSRNPRGMERPAADPALDNLIPVARGEAPVLAIVHKENDFKRLRNLAEEYGMKFWIAGAEEAFRVPGLIQAAGVPVIVSLNYPSIQQVTGYIFDRAYRQLSEEETEVLDDRDQAAVHGNPAAVFNMGVPLALATGGMRSIDDFLGNLRLAVEAGLPADEALKALTINPARMFGVDQVLGTLEVGKIANLTVAGGDIFTEEDAYVAHVFIDGRKESFEKPSPRSSEGGAPGGSVAGEWMVQMSIQGEQVDLTFSLSQEGTNVTGTITTELQAEELVISGTYRDGKLECSGTIPDLGSLTITATVEGDRMSGEMELGPMGLVSFTGKRNPGTIRIQEGGPGDDR